ncbi:hypothetical protein A1D22_08120 [Pasteurellaceae bacterium LFhippo2]|nr:hypothetical protein [Pasteurellaceae bacterium LFhippo2]
MKTSLHQLKWGIFNLLEKDLISFYAKKYGEWAETEVQFFLSILQSQDNVIEVGSNMGLHSIPIAKHIPNGKLFCFEPQRIIFQVLCANLSLNQLSNTYAYQEGVAEKCGITEIPSTNYDTLWNYGAFSIDKGFNTEGDFQGETTKEFVIVTALDSHPEINKLTSLRLLKIDAEGFEINVLDGASQIITKHQPVIFVEAFPERAIQLAEYMDNIDYKCFWFISKRYQKNNFLGGDYISDLDVEDYNLVCVPKSQDDILPTNFKVLLADHKLNNLPFITY